MLVPGVQYSDSLFLCIFFIFLKISSWCGLFSKFLLNLLQCCFWFMFLSFLATRYVGCEFPSQGSNPKPLHWKAKSYPLGCRRSPISIHFKLIPTRLAFLKGSGHVLCSMRVCLIVMKVLVIHWRPALCDPVDCSPLGSTVHGILQARVLEWVAIPFFRVSSQPRDRAQVFCFAGRFFTIWAALLCLLAT